MTPSITRLAAACSTCTLALALGMTASGCATDAQARRQYLEFESFTIENGLYRPKPGWTFTSGKDTNTIVAMRANDSVTITPCDCAIEDGHTREPGGHCAQMTRDGDNGEIREVWCEDNNCGFCVGGIVDEDEPANSVRFDVVCLEDRQVAQD